MLPSRLFRNTGLPPPLRSLITPHPCLPATVAFQLRLRLGVTLCIPNLSRSGSGPSRSYSATTTPSSSSSPTTVTSQTLTPTEPPEPRLEMTFTCTVPECSTRSKHQFTKRAYEKGIVLVECPGCKNRHLIADHLGWFKDGTGDGKHPTVVDLLRARGEKVRMGRLDAGGVVEYVEET